MKSKIDEQVKEFLNTFIIPVFAIILLIVLIVFLFIPRYQSITQTVSNLSTLDSNISVMKQNVDVLNKAKADDPAITNAILNFEVIIPTSGKSAELLSQLETIAQSPKYGSAFFVSAKTNENVDANGKSIQSLNSSSSSYIKPPQGINSIDLIVDVQGSIANIHSFTNELSNQSRLISINDIKWQTEDGNQYTAIYFLTAYFGDKLKTAPISTNISDDALLSPMSTISVPFNKDTINIQTKNINKKN